MGKKVIIYWGGGGGGHLIVLVICMAGPSGLSFQFYGLPFQFMVCHNGRCTLKIILSPAYTY